MIYYYRDNYSLFQTFDEISTNCHVFFEFLSLRIRVSASAAPTARSDTSSPHASGKNKRQKQLDRLCRTRCSQRVPSKSLSLVKETTRADLHLTK